jgi:CubicO group peptidase (beta-lactamase class C family)
MKQQPDILNHLETYIPEAMQEWGIPGLALAVVKDGDVALAKGFGVCELGKSEPVNEHTLFAIASNTKAFTATALGLLVQEGKLTWDDPVVKHLPGFQLYDPYVTHAITIRDLLCHRSGLPTWGGDLIAYGSRYTRDEILHRVRHIPPALGFRSAYSYSNLMYLAAGQIIAAVTPLSWDDFIQQRFFQALGMSRSNTSVRELAGKGNVAMPHELRNGQKRVVPYHPNDNKAPAGSINSTVWDIAQWLRLQLDNGRFHGEQLVDPQIIEETRTLHTPIPIPPSVRKLIPSQHFSAYGLGWGLMDYQGRLVVHHDGGLDGMESMVGFLPEEQLGIVILTNYLPHYFLSPLFYGIVDAYLQVPRQDWNQMLLAQHKESVAKKAEEKKRLLDARVQGTQPTLPLKEYAGKYTSVLYGDAIVREEEGKLSLQMLAHPAVAGELVHWHYDTFLCRWTDPVWDQSLIPFITNGQGQVQEFRVKVREDWIDPLEYIFRQSSDQ